MKVQSTAIRDAVARALIAAYSTAETAGSMVDDVCKAAHRAYKGEAVPKADADAILNQLANARDWDGDIAQVRKSEAKQVLNAYSNLAETVATVKEKHGACSWHSAVKLARCLNKNEGSMKKAIAAFETKGGESKGNPAGRTAGALKAWYKIAKADKKAAIAKAYELLGLKGELA